MTAIHRLQGKLSPKVAGMDREVYSAALRFPPEFPHGRRITFVGLNRTPH